MEETKERIIRVIYSETKDGKEVTNEEGLPLVDKERSYNIKGGYYKIRGDWLQVIGFLEGGGNSKYFFNLRDINEIITKPTPKVDGIDEEVLICMKG